jgi:hypothetical protein
MAALTVLAVAFFGAAIGFWILSAFVADRLKREHPETYEALGGEKAFDLRGDESIATLRAQWPYWKFLLRRSHRSLDDRYLSALSDVVLALFVSSQILVLALLIVVLAERRR